MLICYVKLSLHQFDCIMNVQKNLNKPYILNFRVRRFHLFSNLDCNGTNKI